MKSAMWVAMGCLCLMITPALADRVHDWHDLEEVHKHVKEAIGEMERARAANHYDMDGHGAKAEQFLHDAERELHESIESSKRAH